MPRKKMTAKSKKQAEDYLKSAASVRSTISRFGDSIRERLKGKKKKRRGAVVASPGR